MAVPHRTTLIFCILTILIVGILGIAVSRNIPANVTGFLKPEVNIGRRYVGEHISADFEFVNYTDQEVQLVDTACCGVSSQWIPDSKVSSGGRTTLRMLYTGPPTRKLDQTVHVYAGSREFVLRMVGEVLAGIQAHPSRPVFEIGAEQVSGKLEVFKLFSDDGIPFRVVNVETGSSQVAAQSLDSAVESTQHAISVNVFPATARITEGKLTVETSHPRAHAITIPITIRTLQDILVEPEQFLIGARTREGRVRVWSRTGKAFHLSVTSIPDPEHMKLECTTEDSTAYFLVLGVSQAAPGFAGQICASAESETLAIPIIVLKKKSD